MQKVKICFWNTAVTKLSTQNDKGANFLHVICIVREFPGDNCSMLWNGAGSDAVMDQCHRVDWNWQWRIVKVKGARFRRFNCLALNALGKISTCQISSQAGNGLELIQLLISTNLPTAWKSRQQYNCQSYCYSITSLSLVGTKKSFLFKDGPCSRLHSDQNHLALFSSIIYNSSIYQLF